MIQNRQEIYEKNEKKENFFDGLYVPDDGLLDKQDLENNLQYTVSVYNRYNFTHKYDKSLSIYGFLNKIVKIIKTSPITIISGIKYFFY